MNIYSSAVRFGGIYRQEANKPKKPSSTGYHGITWGEKGTHYYTTEEHTTAAKQEMRRYKREAFENDMPKAHFFKYLRKLKRHEQEMMRLYIVENSLLRIFGRIFPKEICLEIGKYFKV